MVQFWAKSYRPLRIYSKTKSYHNFFILTFDLGVKFMKRKNFLVFFIYAFGSNLNKIGLAISEKNISCPNNKNKNQNNKYTELEQSSIIKVYANAVLVFLKFIVTFYWNFFA